MEETSRKPNFKNAFATAMMAGGDAISGIYGQRGNTYATYIDSQNKRMALEAENIKYQQQAELARQQLMLDKGKLRAAIGENRSQAGLRAAQEKQAIGQANQLNAMAGWMKGLGGNNGQVKIDPITGQPDLSATPTDYRITGFSRGGPKVEDFGALQDKAQIAFDNRAYSVNDAKAITQSEQMIGKIGRLKEMVGTTAEGLAALPWAGGSESGQMFQSLKKDISNTLLYLRSGAQINEEEYKRLTDQLPKLFRRGKVDKDQLTRFEQEFSGINNRLTSGAKWDKKSKSFVSPDGKQVGQPKTYDAKSVFEGL